MSYLVGQTVGPYRIVAFIGQGGMGTIYKARHVTGGHTVALKVLPSLFAADPTMAQRFQREAGAIVRLRHVHIVRVFDVGQAEGLPYLAMEYVEGGSLAERLQDGRPLAPVLVAGWVAQIASALDYAHSQGIVHRDIKPGNILLARDSLQGGERAVLTDFGIALGAGSRLTAPGQIVGTPSYMSPEQAQNWPVGPQSDVYSLGVVAYEMLCGQVPFAGETLAVLRAHVNDSPPRIRRFNPRLSRETERVIERALAKAPGQRFAAAGQFAQALAASLTPRHAGVPFSKDADRRQGFMPPPAPVLSARGRRLVYGALSVLVLSTVVAAVMTSGPPPRTNGRKSPAPSPAGTLAFTRATDSDGDGVITEVDRADICLLDMLSGHWRALTRIHAHNRAPAWSSDGSRIAYVSNSDGDMEIYVMDADGQNTVQRTADRAWTSGPCWSRGTAGSAWIAFDSERDGNSEIYAMEDQGMQTKRLTVNAAMDGDPTWSPAGDRISFGSTRDGNMEIYVMPADGGTPQRLTSNSVEDVSPAWSPDGSTIAFSRGALDGYLDIYLMSADGSAQRPLTHSPTADRWPSWSPDGQWIAFARRHHGTDAWDLYAIRSDGGGLALLLSDGAANMEPAWRP